MLSRRHTCLTPMVSNVNLATENRKFFLISKIKLKTYSFFYIWNFDFMVSLFSTDRTYNVKYILVSTRFASRSYSLRSSFALICIFIKGVYLENFMQTICHINICQKHLLKLHWGLSYNFAPTNSIILIHHLFFFLFSLSLFLLLNITMIVYSFT